MAVKVSEAAASSRSKIATFAPALEKASEIARPIPDPPPVMMAVFPFKFMRGDSSQRMGVTEGLNHGNSAFVFVGEKREGIRKMKRRVGRSFLDRRDFSGERAS